MCNGDVKLVIGDRFTNFGNTPHCVTYHQWREFFLKNEVPSEDCIFIPGLGLSTDQIAEVSRYLPRQFRKYSTYPIATQSQTHKHKSENVLVSTPKVCEFGIYESKLVVQNNNELILDHITGFHLPGMIFLEATRQMATSVVDMLFHDEQKYYVMQDIKAEYLSFAFPIDTDITLELSQIGKCSETKGFSVNLKFIQNGKNVVSTSGSFISADKVQFAKKEQRMAEITAYKVCRNLSKLRRIDEKNTQIA